MQEPRGRKSDDNTSQSLVLNVFVADGAGQIADMLFPRNLSQPRIPTGVPRWTYSSDL